jgi:hypothetical protein
VENGIEELEVEVSGYTKDSVDPDLVDAFPHISPEGDLSGRHVSHGISWFLEWVEMLKGVLYVVVR